jgi:uridine kinase
MSKVIGIAGGSGSGKTTVAKAILERFEVGTLALIQQDAYYRDFRHLVDEERKNVNFDHPDALDSELLVDHINQLKNGTAIERPNYDFTSHLRRSDRSQVHPVDIVLVEGILVLSDPRLRDLMDMKIFIDIAPDIRFIRRLRRDVKERGRSPHSVIEQYLTTVRPMHYQFVEQSKDYADIILTEGISNRDAMELILSGIRTLLDDVSSV